MQLPDWVAEEVAPSSTAVADNVDPRAVVPREMARSQMAPRNARQQQKSSRLGGQWDAEERGKDSSELRGNEVNRMGTAGTKGNMHQSTGNGTGAD